MNRCDFLIIGGGPAGIGAACSLAEMGCDWQLLESENHFGGLSASFVDDHDFTWDLGGHVLFSHYDKFDRHMDLALGKDGWFDHERESWIWLRDRFVPYPFQNNLHRLDPADRDRCVEGLRQAASRLKHPIANLQSPISNFGEWIIATFGAGIADLFMLPYNFKVWAYPPETMDFHWIGERVAVPDLNMVMRSIETGEDHVSWGPNRLFRFPRHGGTGAIWQALGKRLPADRVTLGARVECVDHVSKTAMSLDGRKWKYGKLISTMPLDELIRKAPGVVGEGVADQLVYSSSHIIGIGIDGQPPEKLRTKCWMYFPCSNSPYYRTTVFSNYSPNNVARPGEQWSLMAEVSESSSKHVNSEDLVESCIRAFQEDGLLPLGSKIVTTVSRRIDHAYPTPFLGRDKLVDPVLRRFEEVGIYSRGRFGAWKYEVGNQDHSFAQGYECAERCGINGGLQCEVTLFAQHVVNSKRNE